VVSEPSNTDRRRTRLYSVSPTGLAALKKWLRPPLPDSAVMLNLDLIRTRVTFLRALSPKQRQDLLDDAESRLMHELDSTRGMYREPGLDEFDKLTFLGGIRVLEARLRWIREVRKKLVLDQQGS